MNAPPFVLLFEPVPPGPVPAQDGVHAALALLGPLELRMARNVRQARERAEGAGAASVALALLNGGFLENCALARHMHERWPAMGVVTLGAAGEHQILSLLENGADNALPRCEPKLLARVLSRLLARLGHAGALPSTPAGDHGGQWLLEDQGWVLSGPPGVRFELTTAERAFLLALVSAPEQRASHEALRQAVGGSAPRHAGQRPSGLGVLVSRLRAKSREHGAVLPLKSLHGWGYMLTAACTRTEAEHRPDQRYR